jgi:adenine-specific DNA-methyltransferase
MFQKVVPLLSGESRWVAVRGDGVSMTECLPPASVDSFVSDPPYGINLELRHGRRRTRILGDGRVEARKLWERFIPLAARAAKPDSAHVFFGTWKSLWMAEVLARHFTIKHCAVWVKKQWGLGYYLRPRWEMAWLVHKGKPPIPAKADCDVWEHSRDSLTTHPCRKPVPLLRRAIAVALPIERRDPAAPPLVVDPFAGVFSTGVAAIEEGCRFLGSELDPKYHKMGLSRMSRASGDLTCPV